MVNGRNVLVSVLVVWAILALLALIGVEFIDEPPVWLVEWTKWIASVVSITVGARVLWGTADILIAKANQISLGNQIGGG